MLEAYKDSYVERLEHVVGAKPDSQKPGNVPGRRRYVNADEVTGSMVVGLDREGRICLFNSEAERVTSYARDEVLGRPFLEVMGVDDEKLAQAVAEGLSGVSSTQTVEAGIRNRAGKLRDVIWNLSAAIDGQGNEVVLVAGGRDVTDEKARDERSRQNEKMAAIGTLAAGLAHEIRNPLNGAQLHVAFLERAIKRKGDEQDMLEATRVVGDEIKRLALLVTEFLDFARPRPPELKPTSLIKCLEHACGLVAADARALHVQLVSDPPSSDVEFQADFAKMTQVLLNLLNNAVEATGAAGGGTVVLRGRRGPRQLFIDVEDDGPGLPNPEAPIFDAFYSTKEGGTGLGLAISHRIVTDHRGTIDVSSRPGKTSFRISLPLEPRTGTAI
ncbi:MAG TPA: ATP-binding protein, partial [Polyangiaceae bacterium]|nr:ATP-binding protein [Polyangiaceae bacterium]